MSRTINELFSAQMTFVHHYVVFSLGELSLAVSDVEH